MFVSTLAIVTKMAFICKDVAIIMYICVYVCMYVYIYVFVYVRVYVCMYVSMYVCRYVGMYVCFCGYMFVVCVYLCVGTKRFKTPINE